MRPLHRSRGGKNAAADVAEVIPTVGSRNARFQATKSLVESDGYPNASTRAVLLGSDKLPALLAVYSSLSTPPVISTTNSNLSKRFPLPSRKDGAEGSICWTISWVA